MSEWMPSSLTVDGNTKKADKIERITLKADSEDETGYRC